MDVPTQKRRNTQEHEAQLPPSPASSSGHTATTTRTLLHSITITHTPQYTQSHTPALFRYQTPPLYPPEPSTHHLPHHISALFNTNMDSHNQSPTALHSHTQPSHPLTFLTKNHQYFISYKLIYIKKRHTRPLNTYHSEFLYLLPPALMHHTMNLILTSAQITHSTAHKNVIKVHTPAAPAPHRTSTTTQPYPPHNLHTTPTETSPLLRTPPTIQPLPHNPH